MNDRELIELTNENFHLQYVCQELQERLHNLSVKYTNLERKHKIVCHQYSEMNRKWQIMKERENEHQKNLNRNS